MTVTETSVQYYEYPDAELPNDLKIQVLDFLRIVWPEGFVGASRLRDWTSSPKTEPYHLLYATGRQLVSHLEVITTNATVNDTSYRIASLTSALTYPAFRGEGWNGYLNTKAATRIDASGADIGLLTN